MKAIGLTEYGPPEVLQLKGVEKPSPEDNEILIRNYASSVTNYGDIFVRNFREVSPRELTMSFPPMVLHEGSFGFSKPRTTTLGSEFAGEVESVGKQENALASRLHWPMPTTFTRPS